MKLFLHILLLQLLLPCSQLFVPGIAVLATAETVLSPDESDLSVAVSETTLVTSSRLSQLKRLKLSSSFASHIDVASTRGPMEDTGSLLARSAGLTIHNFGGPGSISTISVRGLNPGHVEVFLDHVPLRSASFAFVDLSTIDLSQIESIDVYRSASPTSLGGGTSGAAICLKTRRGSGRHGSIMFSGGSYQTSKAEATASLSGRGLSGFLSASRFFTAGDFSYFSDGGTDHEPDDDFEAKRSNGDLLRESLLVKIDGQLPLKVKFSGSTQFWRTSQGLPGTRRQATHSVRQYGNGALHRLEISARRNNYYPLRGQLYSFVGRDKRHFRNPDHELHITGAKTRLDQIQDRFGTGLQASWSGFSFAGIGLHSFELLAEIRYEKLEQTTSSTQSTEDTRKRSGRTITVGDAWDLQSGRLHLDLFYRWDQTRDNYHNVNPYRPFSSQPDHSSNFDGPRLGLRYNPIATHTLKANWSREARFPTFPELFGYEGSVLGNPELEPEQGEHWDIGWLWHPLVSPLGIGLSTEFAYYERHLDQMIFFRTISERETKPENLERASIRGMEFSARINHLPLLRDLPLPSPVDANLSLWCEWQSTNDEGLSPVYHGNTLTYHPRWRSSLLLQLSAGPWALHHNARYKGSVYYGRSNLDLYQNKAYWTHDLQLRRRVGNKITLSLRLENLFDQKFEDIPGYPLPGRSWYGGITLKTGGQN